MSPIVLEPVERLRVTVLMDNVTDPLSPDQGPVTRVSWPEALAEGAPRVPSRVATGGAVPDALVASVLVPAHCTGWKAIHHFVARFADAFVQSAVGTTIELRCEQPGRTR